MNKKENQKYNEMVEAEESEFSLSSIDSNDSEYGYGTMIDNIQNLIEKQNGIENIKDEDIEKEYEIFYRGINFMSYPPKHVSNNGLTYKNNEIRKKLEDKNNYKRRLCIKKHVDRTLGKTYKHDYNSSALDNFLHENSTNTTTLFDNKFNGLNQFDINMIGGYVHPAHYNKYVKKLGNVDNKNYGNPLISTSRNANRSLYYTELNRANKNFNFNKHRCMGLLHVFVMHKDKFNNLQNNRLAFDVDFLRSQKVINNPSAREGKNFEVIFKKKIDAEDYVGTIPYVFPKSKFISNEEKEKSIRRYGENENIKNHYAEMVENLAKSHIKKLEKERQENIKSFFTHFFN